MKQFTTGLVIASASAFNMPIEEVWESQDATVQMAMTDAIQNYENVDFDVDFSQGDFTNLKDGGAKFNLLIGSEINAQWDKPDKYWNIVKEQFSVIVSEGACKWVTIHPQQEVYNLTDCMRELNIAVRNDQKFRGHNLCWNLNPEWLEHGNFAKWQLQELLQDHIANVVGGVRAWDSKGNEVRPYVWDVVNEALGDSPPFAIKDSVWYPTLPNYIDIAFTAARKADPKALLFYNDYNIVYNKNKRDAIYNMAKDMQKRGIPIDGIGFQMHVTAKGMRDRKSISEDIAKFGELGLQVHITELDVGIDNTSNDNLQLQGKVYQNALWACLDNPGVCTAFVTWGFTDAYTWLPDKYPLPWDKNYKPKPAYYKLMSVLKSYGK